MMVADVRVGLVAASLVAVGILCPGVGAAQGENDPRYVDARRRYDEGVAIYERGDYHGALAEFQHIYDVLSEPPPHPRRFFVLFDIGRCQEQLYRYNEALESYRRFLAEGGAADRELAGRAQQALAQLEQRLATINIQTNVDSAEVWVDGRPVGTAPGPIRVTGGDHTVELRASGHLPGSQAVQVAARMTETISIQLELAGGLDPALFFTGAAVTLVTLGVAIGFGVTALSERGTLEEELGDPTRAFLVTQQRIDSMQTTALVADILYGAAAALGVVSIIFLFVTDWATLGGEEQSAFRVAPFVSPYAAGVILGASF